MPRKLWEPEVFGIGRQARTSISGFGSWNVGFPISVGGCLRRSEKTLHKYICGNRLRSGNVFSRVKLRRFQHRQRAGYGEPGFGLAPSAGVGLGWPCSRSIKAAIPAYRFTSSSPTVSGSWQSGKGLALVKPCRCIVAPRCMQCSATTCNALQRGAMHCKGGGCKECNDATKHRLSLVIQ